MLFLWILTFCNLGPRSCEHLQDQPAAYHRHHLVLLFIYFPYILIIFATPPCLPPTHETPLRCDIFPLSGFLFQEGPSHRGEAERSYKEWPRPIPIPCRQLPVRISVSQCLPLKSCQTRQCRTGLASSPPDRSQSQRHTKTNQGALP